MFKFGLSLSMAGLAAFSVILAGILSGARIGTILLRGVLGFFAAGGVAYLFAYLVERKWLTEKETLQDTGGRDEAVSMSANPADQEEAAEEEADSSGETGFRPLDEQELERVRP